MTLDIAIGKHREDTSWRNKQMPWEDFVALCSKTHRTAETLKTYLSVSKARQTEIKDIGGFVGGYLAGGRRKLRSVTHRQLITLDADFATPELWADFIMVYGCAGLMYSTHKHTPEKPRIRIIVPLDRPVTPLEYEPIARKVAGNLGIEQFDHTTYEVNRLMYWPSTSVDGEFLFELSEGDFLCADEVLASYRNWQDVSEWPMSDAENAAIKTGIKKQGDPTEKDGVVGAFCRVYTIEEAIETYLSEEYEACEVEGRYTYTEGTTAAGLVVYDGKFAYSHHSTDPTSGKLCNAFDLVRLHKFGLQDEDRDPDTPVNRLPSYLAMLDFARKDAEVSKLIVAERLSAVSEEFGSLSDDEEEDLDWVGKLDIDRKGNLLSTIKNVVLILENDPKLKGRIALDEFERREVLLEDLPWRSAKGNRYLSDVDDANIRSYIEEKYGISSAGKVLDGMTIAINNNAFHPVKDYLNSLRWDGIERVDTLLVDYLGADDNAYTRAVTRKTLTAAVARIFEPGKKFDYVLTFVGEQGMKKSSFIAALGGQWFSDSFGDIEKKKEVMEQIQGVWLVEIGEMAGMRKADVESIKQFISKRDDRYRVAYGRRVEYFPRQCVFFATTNNQEFLRDPTGNRRFWPVPVHKGRATQDVMEDMNEYERGQIWAEAVEFYRAGETLYLPEDIEAMAREVQAQHSESDAREGLILRYLDTLLPECWDEWSTFERRQYIEHGPSSDDQVGVHRRDRVCAAEIWCEALGGNQKDMTTHNTKFIHDTMRNMPGWSASAGKITFKIFGKQNGYLRQKSLRKA